MGEVLNFEYGNFTSISFEQCSKYCKLGRKLALVKVFVDTKNTQWYA